MGNKPAKTASGEKYVEKKLPCPKCGKPMTLGMSMPKRTMKWYCFSCDYEQLKIKGDINAI